MLLPVYLCLLLCVVMVNLVHVLSYLLLVLLTIALPNGVVIYDDAGVGVVVVDVVVVVVVGGVDAVYDNVGGVGLL